MGLIRNTLATVPVTYSTARRHGLGTLDSIRVVRATGLALALSSGESGTDPGEKNALRHFIWQAYLTARWNESLARAVADAHEVGSSDARDSRVDQRNNTTARAYGVAHHDEIRQGSTRKAMSRLLDVGRQLWDQDELVWIKPH